MNNKKTIIVAGGGPAGLMAAWRLAPHFRVLVFEKENTCGRKFLVAGKGGLNITNSTGGDALFSRYIPGGFADEALTLFGPQQLQDWLSALGIPTYTGSSGRVFPIRELKASEVLRRMIASVVSRGAGFYLNHRLVSFDQEMKFIFDTPDGNKVVKADYAVLAFGGASWPVTGSDGKWTNMLNACGIETLEFQPSNCGVEIDWPPAVLEFHEGKPLKNVELSVNGKTSKGEVLITACGLEGNALYPLIPGIRQSLAEGEVPVLTIDFKPFNQPAQLMKRLGNAKPGSSAYLKCFGLSPQALAVVKALTGKEEYLDCGLFVSKLKGAPVKIKALRPLEEAISSVGGLVLSEISGDYSLRKFPRIFAIGEMLDWDAPTGGFLLQACFSMGYFAGTALLKREGFGSAFE